MKCPKCSRRLRVDADVCLCGWSKAGGGVRRHYDCAHAPQCTKNGVIREKTETGWAVFCEDHYIAYCHRKSEKRVREELGLKTVEEMKAFCRQKVKTIFRSVRSGGNVEEREPGQDDEELTDDRRAA